MTRILYADLRGYLLVANPDGSYRAGCRYFPDRAAALAHWGSPEYPNPDIGAEYCDAIRRDQALTELPAGLQLLSLHGATLPAGIVLPDGLRRMNLSDGATLPAGIVLPDGLQELHLYSGATLPADIVLPPGLHTLCLGGNATLPAGTVLPAGLHTIYLVSATLPAGIVLPAGLQELHLYSGATLPAGTVIPTDCKVIQ